MITHAIFPTTICEFDYDFPYKFKELFWPESMYYLKNGYSGEKTNVSLHTNPKFEELYKWIISCSKQYMSTLNVDDVFTFNVVKSFLNISREKCNPLHSHKDAHISFIYYLNIPDEITHNIRFYNYENRHEPFHKCIQWNNSNEVWDILNSYTWQFTPNEGKLFIFPSNLIHDTIGFETNECINNPVKDLEDLKKTRISLVGDILLTYKKNTHNPLGIQPVENWRTFE